MKKRIINTVKLIVPAGQAKPSPPVGPAIGQHGLNIMEFCKNFNDKTKIFKSDTLIAADVKIFEDKTYELFIKLPSNKTFIFKALTIGHGSAEPGKQCIGKISVKTIYEIAKYRKLLGDGNDLPALCKMLAGSAKSLGLIIKK